MLRRAYVHLDEQTGIRDMEVELASFLTVGFWQIGTDCIRCNWDSALGGLYWIPGLSSVLGIGLGIYEYSQGGATSSSPPIPPAPTPPTAAGDTGPGDTSVGLNDLFGETDRFQGVGDTANPTYSDTSADDRIAAEEARRQFVNDYYRATHPGATTAGPSQPTPTEQAGSIFRRALEEHIRDQ
jgi:hypothetical protein